MSQEFTPEHVEKIAAFRHREGCHTSGDMLDAYAATLRAEAFATVAASKPCPACGSRSPCADAEACGSATLRQPAARVDVTAFRLALCEAADHTVDLSESDVRAALEAALSAQPAPERQGRAYGHEFEDMAGKRHFVRGPVPTYAQSNIVPLYTHPAAPVGVPDGMTRIGHLIATQDNRITEQPIFIVQQKRESVGHPDYDNARIAWVSDENSEAGPTESAELESAFADDGIEPKGWRRLAICVHWDFVTACFTEQGCKDYLARNGHNLREPRIYAEGSFRNEEWREVRSFLLSIAAAPSAPQGTQQGEG